MVTILPAWSSHSDPPLHEYYCQRPQLSMALLRESPFAAGPQDDMFRAQVERVAEALVARIVEQKSKGGAPNIASPGRSSSHSCPTTTSY